MNILRRRGFRALAAVLAVLLLAVLAVKIFLPADKVRDLALKQARERLGREVTLADVGVSLRGGLGVRLGDLAVHNPDGFGGDPLLTTHGVDLKLAILPLLKGEIRVHRLVLDEPRLNLVKRADGTDNFTFEPPAGKANTGTGTETEVPPPLSVTALSLRGGGLIFTNEGAPEGGAREVRLEGLDADFSLDDVASNVFRAEGEATLERLAVAGPEGLPEFDAALEFDVNWEQGPARLVITRAEGTVLGMPASATGALIFAEDAAAGALNVTAPEQPIVGLRPLLPPELRDKLAGDAGSGKIAGTAALDFTGDATAPVAIRTELVARDVDLALAQPFMPPDRKAELAGRGQADVVIEVPADGFSRNEGAAGIVRAAGEVTLEAVKITAPEGLPETDAVFQFDMNWEQGPARLVITRAEGTILGMPASAAGALTFAADAAAGELRVTVPEQPIVGLRPLLLPEFRDKLEGDTGSGKFAGTAALDFTGDTAAPVAIRTELVARDVDLALAQPFMPPDRKGKLAGRGEANIVIDVPAADPKAFTWRGTARVQGASFTETAMIDELRELDARLKFTPDLIEVTESRARFASGAVTATGSLRDPFPYFLPPEMQAGKTMKTPHLAFELRSAHLDVDRLIPAASPSGPMAGGRTGMTRRAPVPEGVEFPAITGRGTVRADTVVYMQVPVTTVTANVEIGDRKILVRDVVGAAYNGTLGGKLDIDLNDLNDPAYEGHFAAKNIEADNFVTRFAGLAGVVFGGCNLSGDFGARGLEPAAILGSLTMDADALLSQGRLVTRGKVHESLGALAARTGGTLDKEQALRDLATHLSVKDGRVHLSDLKSKLGTLGDVAMGGSYGFDGSIGYEGTLTLSAATTKRLFEQGGPMAELNRLLGARRPERLALPLSVGGTRTDPKVNIDLGGVLGDLQQAALKEQGGKLEDEAKKKLGDLLKKGR